MSNFIYFVFFFIAFYSLLLYFIFKKSEIVEVFLTGFFILVVGWLNMPNFFPLKSEIVNNTIAFLPYRVSYMFGFAYAMITAALLIIIVEGLKYVTRKKYWNFVKGKKMNNEYEQFTEDAKSLYVIGYDFDFLKDNDTQVNKFKKIGNSCKILITSNFLSEEIKDIISDLIKSNVDIRKIDTNTANEFCNLRGQIKIDSSGRMTCLFVEKASKLNKTYKKINITNKFILTSLFDEFNKMHNAARHPLIKCVAVDLGGVYFNGDFHKDFVDVINEEIGTDVLSSSEDTMLLDRDLNLGKKNIVKYWEEKSGILLSPEQKKIILTKWKNTWTPNYKMIGLVKELVSQGYHVYPVGNIDKENGENYKKKGYFEAFNKNSFMSYENRGKKESIMPDIDFYFNFMAFENYKPYEILLIDDEYADINGAIEANWNTIHFHISKNVETLRNELIKLNIIKKVDVIYPLKIVTNSSEVSCCRTGNVEEINYV